MNKQQLITELRDYARDGADVAMRARCATAADSVEQGCELVSLRNQLSVEVESGDTAMAALVVVNYAIWSRPHEPLDVAATREDVQTAFHQYYIHRAHPELSKLYYRFYEAAVTLHCETMQLARAMGGQSK